MDWIIKNLPQLLKAGVCYLIAEAIGEVLFHIVVPPMKRFANRLGGWLLVLVWTLTGSMFALSYYVGTRNGPEAFYGFPIWSILLSTLVALRATFWWRDQRSISRPQKTSGQLGPVTRIILGLFALVGAAGALIMIYLSGPSFQLFGAVLGWLLFLYFAVVGRDTQRFFSFSRLRRKD